MKKKYLGLSLLALVLVLSAAIRPSLAYFTDNARADGAVSVTLAKKTEVSESFDLKTWVKEIRVSNDADAGTDMYFRARAYAGQTYDLTVTPANGWSDGGDGWFYYQTPVAPGESTGVLRVAIGNVPAGEEVSDFNVAVIYESTPAQYNADGSAKPADWSAKLDLGVTESGSDSKGGEGNA